MADRKTKRLLRWNLGFRRQQSAPLSSVRLQLLKRTETSASKKRTTGERRRDGKGIKTGNRLHEFLEKHYDSERVLFEQEADEDDGASSSTDEKNTELDERSEEPERELNSSNSNEDDAVSQELDNILASTQVDSEKNTRGETVLHLATSPSVVCPSDLLNKLIKGASVDTANAHDRSGRTALDRLIDLPRPIDISSLKLFHAKRVDFLKPSSEGIAPPLHALIRRQDGHEHVKAILDLFQTATLQKNWSSILEIALKEGSADTFKILLEYGDSKQLQVTGPPLLHSALTCNCNKDKIDVLLDLEKKPAKVDAEHRNWFHVAAESKPPQLSRAEQLLRKKPMDGSGWLEKSEVSQPDQDGDTPLHKAAKNYAQRSSDNQHYKEAMRMLLDEYECGADVRNKRGLTPLQCLLIGCRFTPSEEVLRLFFHWNGFLMQTPVKEEINPHERFPLADLVRRSDGSQLLKLIEKMGDGWWHEIGGHLKYMLEAAVKGGSAEMVQHLLSVISTKRQMELSSQDWLSLFTHASLSVTDPGEKIRCLVNINQHIYDKETFTWSPPQSAQTQRTPLHAAAGSTQPCVDAVAAVVENLKVNPDQRDAEGYTAMHISAGSLHQGSKACLMYLLDQSPAKLHADVDVAKRLPITPLGSLLNSLFGLEDDRPLPDDAKEKVVSLLEEDRISSEKLMADLDWLSHGLGCNRPKPRVVKWLFLDPEVVTASNNPLHFLLVLAEFCQGQVKERRLRKSVGPMRSRRRGKAKKKSRQARAGKIWREMLKWESLHEKLEREAIVMISEYAKNEEEFKDVLTEREIRLAKKIKWNQFLSQKSVGSCLQEIFLGHTTAMPKKDDVDFMYGWWKEGRWKQPQQSSWEKLHLVALLFFFLLQSAFLPIILPLSICFSGECCNYRQHWRHYLPLPPGEIPAVTWGANAIGYVIFVGLLIGRTATVEQEVDMTVLDWVIVVYIVALMGQEWRQMRIEGLRYISKPTNWFDVLLWLLLVVGYVVRGVGFSDDDGSVVRVSEILFGFAVMLACLRLLAYVQLHRKIGPIQISFRSILRDVVYFLIILAIFLLAFAVGITGIYNGAAYVDGQTAPDAVDGLWSSIVTLYWSLFGMAEVSDLTSDDSSPEMTAGLCVFAVWLLVSIIVLLNMLIALVNSAFVEVQTTNADLVWHDAYITAIQEMREYFPFPLPMNLFQNVADMIFYCCHPNLICDQKAALEESYEVTVRVGHSEESRSQIFRMKESYRIKRMDKDEDEEDAVVTRDPVEELHDKINEMNDKIDQYDDDIESKFEPVMEALDHLGKIQYRLDAQAARRLQETIMPLRKSVKKVLEEQKRIEEETSELLKEELRPILKALEAIQKAQKQIAEEMPEHVRQKIEPLLVKLTKDLKERIEELQKTLLSGIKNPAGIDEQMMQPEELLPLFRLYDSEQSMIAPAGKRLASAQPALQTRHTENLSQCSASKCQLAEASIASLSQIYSRRELETDPFFGLRYCCERVLVTPTSLEDSPAEYNIKYQPGNDSRVGTFRAINSPISPEFTYFEVEILEWGRSGYIGIGLASESYPYDQQPGWIAGSFGFHADDGRILIENDAVPVHFESPCRKGDVIGCGVDYLKSPIPDRELMVFFRLGQDEIARFPFQISGRGRLYPSIGMRSGGEEVRMKLTGKPPYVCRPLDARFRVLPQCMKVKEKAVLYISNRFDRVGACQYTEPCSSFKVGIVNVGKTADISIGFAPLGYPLDVHPGWGANSVAFHGGDGCLYQEYRFGLYQLGAPTSEKDEIQCKAISQGDDCSIVQFIRNGVQLGETTMKVPPTKLYPTIGMRSDGAVVVIHVIDADVDCCENKIVKKNKSPNLTVYGNVVMSSGDGNEEGSYQVDGTRLSPACPDFGTEILSTGSRGEIALGVAGRHFPVDLLPGFLPGSVAYYCDCGEIQSGVRPIESGHVLKQGDEIQCGIVEFKKRQPDDGFVTVFYNLFRNGQPLKTTKKLEMKVKLPKGGLYPTIGMVSNGEVVRIEVPFKGKEQGEKDAA